MLVYYLVLAPIIDKLLYSISNEPRIIRSYIPVFGFALQFAKDPYGFIHWLHHQYGSRVVVDIMSRRYLFFNDQTTFMTRIAKDPGTFTIDYLDRIVHNGGGIRMECIRNAEAKRVMLKEYHEFLFGQELIVLNQKTYDHLFNRLSVDSTSETVNLFDYFGEIIFDTAVTVLYGQTFARSQPDLYGLCQTFEDAVAMMLLDVPFKSFLLRSAVRQRNQFIERFLDLKPNDDMSACVLARIESMASLDDGKVFNRSDRAGYHGLLLWAAVVNTIPTACWALVDLLLHEDAMEAVKNELNIKLRNIASLSDKETLRELRMLDSCIQETMRRTSTSMTLRQASANATVTCTDGTSVGIRKDDIIVYSALIKCFDPQVSLNFSPRRWYKHLSC